ncbi:MAG: HTH domain-containing protein [Peptostreptococcus porci]|nr:HTH domain-containing protein [Peptostreptococcus porci]
MSSAMADSKSGRIKKDARRRQSNKPSKLYHLGDNMQQQLKEQVLRQLSDEPIKREDLSRRLGVSDRGVREAIARLREQGIPICSNSDNKGYWLARNEAEINHTIKEYRARAFKMLKVAKALENSFTEVSGNDSENGAL